mmetsp:Transcript_70560/g.86562  ORF Transcript_70560/g.86562 Transcript_70560/m.86562 type:complete len:98 (-) Transcript_70560:159-452(-)
MPQHQIGLELTYSYGKSETEYQHILAAFVDLDKEMSSIHACDLECKLRNKYGYVCIVAKNCIWPNFSCSWGIKFKNGVYGWKLKKNTYNVVIIRGMK